MKKTHIWTTQEGKKIPVCLMEDKHLLAVYVRLTEIFYSKRFKNKEYKNLENETHTDMILSQMDSSRLDFEFVQKWLEIFKVEIRERKLKFPNTDRLSIDYNFKKKQIKKEIKLEQNKKFDSKFN